MEQIRRLDWVKGLASLQVQRSRVVLSGVNWNVFIAIGDWLAEDWNRSNGEMWRGLIRGQVLGSPIPRTRGDENRLIFLWLMVLFPLIIAFLGRFASATNIGQDKYLKETYWKGKQLARTLLVLKMVALCKDTLKYGSWTLSWSRLYEVHWVPDIFNLPFKFIILCTFKLTTAWNEGLGTGNLSEIRGSQRTSN